MGRPSHAWRIADAEGHMVAVHARFDKDDGKRLSWWRSGRWGLSGVKTADLPLYGSELVADFDIDAALYVTEGERAADALRAAGYQALGTVTGASGTPGAAPLSVLAGRRIVLWPDLDEVGTAHMERIAEALDSVAASVEVVDVAALGLTEPGSDAAEWLATSPTGPPPIVPYQPEPTDGRTAVVVSDNLERVASDVLVAMAERGGSGLYSRGDLLYHVVSEPEPGEPARWRMRPAALARVRDIVSDACRFIDAEGEPAKSARTASATVAASIVARGEWPGIPPLTGVTTSPVLRRDGSVCVATGYDAATGFLRVDDGVTYPLVPEAPSLDQARAAARELLEVVAEFPFATAEHRGAWLATLLGQAAGIRAIGGPVPLTLFEAPAAGAGKDLLAAVSALVATGEEPAVEEWPADVAEQRKVLDAIALAGHRVVVFGNVTAPLGGSALDRTLTASRVAGRYLGASRLFDLPQMTSFGATANNPAIGADTSRRLIAVRLDPRCERPELRSGWRHPDLLGYVRRERPRLYIAALTVLVYAWRTTGATTRPLAELLREQAEAGLPAMGSFERWSVLIRGAVLALGLAELGDPVATREAVREAATSELSDLVGLVDALAAWLAATGRRHTTVRAMLDDLGASVDVLAPPSPDLAAARTALAEALSAATETPAGRALDARAAGKAIAARRDRFAGRRRIVAVPVRNRAKVAEWTVETADEPADNSEPAGLRGCAGLLPDPSREKSECSRNTHTHGESQAAELKPTPRNPATPHRSPKPCGAADPATALAAPIVSAVSPAHLIARDDAASQPGADPLVERDDHDAGSVGDRSDGWFEREERWMRMQLDDEPTH